MATTTIRVSDETREQLAQVARDLGAASTDETIRRLLDEHRHRQWIDTMDQFRANHPDEWQAYLDEADELDQASAPAGDAWDDQAWEQAA